MGILTYSSSFFANSLAMSALFPLVPSIFKGKPITMVSHSFSLIIREICSISRLKSFVLTKVSYPPAMILMGSLVAIPILTSPTSSAIFLMSAFYFLQEFCGIVKELFVSDYHKKRIGKKSYSKEYYIRPHHANSLLYAQYHTYDKV